MKVIYKNPGETPLEALERFRREQIDLADKSSDKNMARDWKTVPMTYAGRLDPMAEGELLILISEECKNKDKYLGLDKEYEVEIVFGIETDTYDALGLAKVVKVRSSLETLDLQKYVGKFTQEYPPYSSKTVDGTQLHELARTDSLPENMPKREVEIYEIEVQKSSSIGGHELLAQILDKVDLVNGDFRQNEIKQRWYEVLDDGVSGGQQFEVMNIRVKCSSGTYMRSLAHKIGQDMACGAFALGIKRTKIIGL